MFKVSKKSQYGLRAMIFLAKNYNPPAGGKQFFSVKSISEKEGISFGFLEKIILHLEKAMLVKSKRGIAGGYFLAKPPVKISVGDIVYVLEGKTPLVKCILCGKSKKCAAKNVWDKIEISLRKTLKSIKLKNLI